MTDERDVAITGIGIVSALGIGRDAFWTRLSAGESGIAPTTVGGAAQPVLAAAVRDFIPREFIVSPHLRRMDYLSRLIVAASRLAIADSGIAVDQLAPERIGVVIGSAYGNVSESVAYLERVLARGPAAASPMLFPNLVMNAPASYVAMEIGATGVNFTLSQGEASGEHAIIMGAELIRSGRADLVLVGGGDELSPTVLDVYGRCRALSSQRGGAAWSSPYDRRRNGLILGEGAAVILLEPAASRRGAAAYATIEDNLRFAVQSPAYDWPATAHGAIGPLRGLITGTTGVDQRVDLICGAANSSRRLDGCELDLFARMLGEAAGGVWLTSIKGAIGEIGAGGAFNVAVASLALHDQSVPPLCHLREPEPGAPFRFAAATAMGQPLQRVLVSGLSRGGSGAALLLKQS